jgi:ribose 5-phosphate isomerase A
MRTVKDSEEHSAIDGLKQEAANLAAEQLRDGMVVGLGSGSTASLAVAAIGQRVKSGLRIIGIPTSDQTRTVKLPETIRLSYRPEIFGIVQERPAVTCY